MRTAASMAKSFKPTGEQIAAAKLVFACMAIVQTIRPIVEGYQRAILAFNQWPTAKKWTELEGRRAMEQKPILEPKHSYLLEGEDFATYLALCKIAQANAKLVTRNPESCPLLESEHDLIKAEHAFITATACITGLEPERIFSASMELRKQLIDINLRLFARYCQRCKP